MNETNLGRAARYLLLGAGAVLLGLWFCGCQTTPQPPGPDDLNFPPVKYGGPPMPPKQEGWHWSVLELAPAWVRLEWEYPEGERNNIVFRVYRSAAPTWGTNWVGWECCGETIALVWAEPIGNIQRQFYTVTASNTLTGLESDPARRE